MKILEFKCLDRYYKKRCQARSFGPLLPLSTPVINSIGLPPPILHTDNGKAWEQGEVQEFLKNPNSLSSFFFCKHESLGTGFSELHTQKQL